MITLKPFLIAASAALALATPAKAEEPGQCELVKSEVAPLEFTRNLYGVAQADLDACLPLPERLPYSKRLAAAFAAEEARIDTYQEPIGRLDFDYVVDGQDALITEVEIKEYDVRGGIPADPDRKVVTAKFKNFGAPVSLSYYWVKEDGAWVVDEVVSDGSPDNRGWVLSLILDFGS